MLERPWSRCPSSIWHGIDKGYLRSLIEKAPSVCCACKTRAKTKPEKTHARSTPQVFTPTWRRCNDSDTVAVMAAEAYGTLNRPLQKDVQLCAPRCPRHLAFLLPRHAAYRLRTHASLPCPIVLFACARVRAVRGHRCQSSSRTARLRHVPPLAAAWRPRPCAPAFHPVHRPSAFIARASTLPIPFVVVGRQPNFAACYSPSRCASRTVGLAT